MKITISEKLGALIRTINPNVVTITKDGILSCMCNNTIGLVANIVVEDEAKDIAFDALELINFLRLSNTIEIDINTDMFHVPPLTGKMNTNLYSMVNTMDMLQSKIADFNDSSFLFDVNDKVIDKLNRASIYVTPNSMMEVSKYTLINKGIVSSFANEKLCFVKYDEFANVNDVAISQTLLNCINLMGDSKFYSTNFYGVVDNTEHITVLATPPRTKLQLPINDKFLENLKALQMDNCITITNDKMNIESFKTILFYNKKNGSNYSNIVIEDGNISIVNNSIKSELIGNSTAKEGTIPVNATSIMDIVKGNNSNVYIYFNPNKFTLLIQLEDNKDEYIVLPKLRIK